MRLPPGFNRRLQRFDSDLRIRWSGQRERWLLERRARYARADINPATYPRDALDTFRQLNDGFFGLGSYAPRNLPPIDMLITQLQMADTHRMGVTAQQIAAKLEYDEATAKERRRVAAKRDGEDLASDAWDMMQWANGSRVAVPA